MAEGRGEPKPSGSGNYAYVVECRHHPGAPLIEDHAAGDMICQECGLVVGDRSALHTTHWKPSFSTCRTGEGRLFD